MARLKSAASALVKPEESVEAWETYFMQLNEDCKSDQDGFPCNDFTLLSELMS